MFHKQSNEEKKNTHTRKKKGFKLFNQKGRPLNSSKICSLKSQDNSEGSQAQEANLQHIPCLTTPEINNKLNQPVTREEIYRVISLMTKIKPSDQGDFQFKFYLDAWTLSRKTTRDWWRNRGNWEVIQILPPCP
jgi:hypothetical protein